MKDIYSKRREVFLGNLKDNSLAIFFAGKDHNRSTCDRNFYYYTGLNKQNMCLALLKTDSKTDTILFIEPFDPVQAKWVGPRMLKDEAQEISGIENVRYTTEYFDVLETLMESNPTLWLDLSKDPVMKNPNSATVTWLNKEYENVQYEDYAELVNKQRIVKDDAEIEMLKVAQTHTLKAITEMMQHVKPEMGEAELVGVFNLGLAKQNIQEYAFPAICAGGVRATTLHYSDNNQALKDGELCLVDLGSSYKYYCADISRTYPVNGKFTARQKEVYDVVLGAQNLVLQNAKPGLSVLDLNEMVIKYYEEELPKIGLLKDGKTVRDYYYHSVSHYLGLVCHDVGDRKGPMPVGAVISNEPGLYIEEEGIGIRIEDDLLITENGAINLSKDFPHTTEEIEALMAK